MSIKWRFTKEGIKIDHVNDAYEKMNQLLNRHTNDELIVMASAIENVLNQRHYSIKIKLEVRE